VLLATAEDAGRAVDMFSGYMWQTTVLEVRLDRMVGEGVRWGMSNSKGSSRVGSNHTEAWARWSSRC